MPRDADSSLRDSAYWEAYEAGALAALDHVTDERPDLTDLTLQAATKIGAHIDECRRMGVR